MCAAIEPCCFEFSYNFVSDFSSYLKLNQFVGLFKNPYLIIVDWPGLILLSDSRRAIKNNQSLL